MNGFTEAGRSQDPGTRNPWWPFRRADSLAGSSMFWLPVSNFPVRSQEKQWLLGFFALFSEGLKNLLEFRQENFLNFDHLYPHLQDPFLRHTLEFNPIPGMLVEPSKPLFRPPTEEQLREILESGDASRIRNAPKNIAYWLAKKKGLRQMEVFFGFGAMVSLWLPVTDETRPPDFRLPKKALKNPAFAGLDLEAEIEFTYSLRDPFLPKSKQLFAPDMAGDPQYGGTPFAVPLLTAQDVFYARGEQREAWLELFGAYASESRADQGILLWGRKDVEPVMLECLRILHEQDLKYPTVPQP